MSIITFFPKLFLFDIKFLIHFDHNQYLVKIKNMEMNNLLGKIKKYMFFFLFETKKLYILKSL